MTLTNHAKQRIMQRSKIASLMRPKEFDALIQSAKRLDKDLSYKYAVASDYYLLESIDLVLVVNPMGAIITVYHYSTSKGFKVLS